MNKKEPRNPIGYTDLLGVSGISKTDLRVNLLGSLDEASASLGMAKAFLPEGSDKTCLESCQKELSMLMGYVASIGTPNQQKFASDFFQAELEALEKRVNSIKTKVKMPKGFIYPGDTQATGCLNMSRAIIRRTERDLNISLDQLGLQDLAIRQYLNRLSSLCYLLVLKYSHHE